MSEVSIKSCSCNHKYQDKVYGPGLRVFNQSSDGTKMKCTVCDRPLNIGGGKK